MEQLEDLECDGLKIYQDKSLYTFTSDAVILANFLKIKRGEIAVEIGGGSGVISILATAKNPVEKIYIFEIQEDLKRLCEKNIKLNNLSEQLELFCDDVKNYIRYIQKPVDVVFSNPPYFKPSGNKLDDELSSQTTNIKEVEKFCIEKDEKNENLVKKIARQEIMLNLKDLIECASKMLKFHGRFYCVYPADRTAELLTACTINHLEPKRMFFTDNGKGKITLVVLEAVKGASAGVSILPTLTTNLPSGEFLAALTTRKFKTK